MMMREAFVGIAIGKLEITEEVILKCARNVMLTKKE